MGRRSEGDGSETPGITVGGLALLLLIVVAGVGLTVWLSTTFGLGPWLGVALVIGGGVTLIKTGEARYLLLAAPYLAACVAAGFLPGTEVHAAFFTTVAQIIPVLLLALGVEQRMLRDIAAQADAEFMTFLAVLVVLGVGELGAVYGAAACPDTPEPCKGLPGWVLPAAGSGAAAGVVGVLAIAAVATLRRDE